MAKRFLIENRQELQRKRHVFNIIYCKQKVEKYKTKNRNSEIFCHRLNYQFQQRIFWKNLK